MSDRNQLTKDILELADRNMQNFVDIAPIIEKYSNGLEINQQRRLRADIWDILKELETHKEIESESSIGMITVSRGEVFNKNGGLIRSTYKRSKELEKNNKVNDAKRIQLSTRRDILDSFLITGLSWAGRLDQVGFLGRLYDLSKLPSKDPRFETASEDIQKHTLFNNDWPEDWVFTDSRFNILHAGDKEFLDFLCLTLHPTVRPNVEDLNTLLGIYDNYLRRDGITLVKIDEIAGRPVFSSSELSSISQKGSIGIAMPTQSPPVRKALVIGCSSYINVTPLRNPINDADGIETALNKLGFEVVKKIDPNQKELKMAIDEFGSILQGSDVGLFYFAGHGLQVKGVNYLVPVDANPMSESHVEYDCIDAGRVLASMEHGRPAVNLLILDACRNNPFERSWGRTLGHRGLASMDAPHGSLIAYATSPGKTASDGEGVNGLYTEALLNHIEVQGISISTLFQKVRSEVIKKSNQAQTPWEATSLTADFFFSH